MTLLDDALEWVSLFFTALGLLVGASFVVLGKMVEP